MPNDSAALDRRRFLTLTALAGLGVVARPDGAFAQAPTPSATTAPPTAPSATPPTAAAPATQTPSEDARAIVGVLRRRYAGKLSDEQWETVMRDVDGDLAAGKRLREAKLANADEPDMVFRP